MITQGKWEVDGFFVCRQDSPATKDQPVGATYICEIDRAAVSDEDALDNARLIAAAPDLLAACKAQEAADNWFGPSNTGKELTGNARIMRQAAVAKTKE